MAMDDTSMLEEQILHTLQEQSPIILDNEVLSIESVPEVQADGSTLYTQTENRGAVELDANSLEKMRPLARAIARAVVNYIKENAQVDLGTGRIS